MRSRDAAFAAAAATAVVAVFARITTRAPKLPQSSKGVEEFLPAHHLGPFHSASDVIKRIRCWIKLVCEWWELCRVYEQHRDAGWFDFGCPAESFEQLKQHPAMQALLALRQHSGHSTLQFEADHAVLPTYLPIEEGAAAALGAVAIAAADLFELRTGRAQRVVVNQSGAGLTTAQYLFMYCQPSGKWGGLHGFDGTMAAEGTVKPQRKAYKCRDGAWVFLHGGFPKLKKGLTDFLRCELTVEAMGAACARWDALELETAMQQAGLAATKCRTPMEWRDSKQGQLLAALPPVCVERESASTAAGAAAPASRTDTPRLRALPVKASRPLSDVLVLDFSHVIASPVVGRTLADHGATVLKLVSHARPRREMFDCETNHGKAPLAIELGTAEGRERLWELLRVADVLIDGYTQGALAKHGFGVDEVLRRNPHLVYLDLSCFGHVGPLAHGKGFQQNANFAAGVAGIEDEALLGYQLVSQVDYATGYIGAYGVILGLIERQRTAAATTAAGGISPTPCGVVVRCSLCQTAMWMSSFGARAPGAWDFIKRVTRLLWLSDRRSTTVGDHTYLPPDVAVRMSITPPRRHGFERWWPDDAPTDDLVVNKK